MRRSGGAMDWIFEAVVTAAMTPIVAVLVERDGQHLAGVVA
jgi:hypothetical protein